MSEFFIACKVNNIENYLLNFCYKYCLAYTAKALLTVAGIMIYLKSILYLHDSHTWKTILTSQDDHTGMLNSTMLCNRAPQDNTYTCVLVSPKYKQKFFKSRYGVQQAFFKHLLFHSQHIFGVVLIHRITLKLTTKTLEDYELRKK